MIESNATSPSCTGGGPAKDGVSQSHGLYPYDDWAPLRQFHGIVKINPLLSSYYFPEKNEMVCPSRLKQPHDSGVDQFEAVSKEALC